MTLESKVGRGIISYDFLSCLGGAERVTLALMRGIPESDLCVGFRNPGAFSATDVRDLRCRELGAPPGLRLRGWRTLKGMHVFRSRSAFFREYDWALYSGTCAPVSVRHRPSGGNLYYCHTLPRFAYDLNEWYEKWVPAWQRPALAAVSRYVRREYEGALRQMDCIIANSVNVQSRLRRYLGVRAEVINPPCDVEGFRWLGQDGYYLSTARLECYKRVDRIIDAFRQMPERELVVASGGSDEPRLRRLAGRCANIRFVGWQSECGLRRLVGNALATVYLAKDEDFGMSPVESMAAGKPVIGVAEGGLLETVVNNQTGVLVSPELSVEELVGAIRNLPAERALGMRAACERRAGQFSVPRFLDAMRASIRTTAAVSLAHL